MDKISNIEKLFPVQRKTPVQRETIQYKPGFKQDYPQASVMETKAEPTRIDKEPKIHAIRKSEKYNKIDRNLLLEKMNKKNAKVVGIAEKKTVQATPNVPSYMMPSLDKPREIQVVEKPDIMLSPKYTSKIEETLIDDTEDRFDEDDRDDEDQLIVTKKQDETIVIDGSPDDIRQEVDQERRSVDKEEVVVP